MKVEIASVVQTSGLDVQLGDFDWDRDPQQPEALYKSTPPQRLDVNSLTTAVSNVCAVSPESAEWLRLAAERSGVGPRRFTFIPRRVARWFRFPGVDKKSPQKSKAAK